MPLTVSNKIDRKLLQEIGSSITAHKITELKGAGKAEILSLTNDERQLAVIWSDALGINSEGICPDDSFWDLGGDSLTAMQIVFTAQKAGIHLNVADIFAYPVLRTLALHTSKYMPPTVKLHAPTLEDSEERPAEIMAHFRWYVYLPS
jgi:acyl carrier protein